jgi:hypothetical protein
VAPRGKKFSARILEQSEPGQLGIEPLEMGPSELEPSELASELEPSEIDEPSFALAAEAEDRGAAE